METVRLLPPPRYPHHYPPRLQLLPDLHPALAHYISYYSEPLAPLDLSVKPSPITPPCTPPPAQPAPPAPPAPPHDTKEPPKIFRHFVESEPELATDKRRTDDDDDSSPEIKKLKFTRQFFEELKSCLPERAATPTSAGRGSPGGPRDVEQRPRKAPPPPLPPQPPPAKKSKAARRLHFDEDNTSPVSGTIIRHLADDETLVVRKGDIDPAFNVVEVTEEAKALLAGIDNRLGRYLCRLCRRLYTDAFALAQHRCERIVHIEYRCPECDKVFNCPANLASHRRWHKPRPAGGGGKPAAERRAPAPGDPAPLDVAAEGNKFSCKVCGKTFRRQAYLRKHYLAHDAAGRRSADAEPAPAPAPERSAFRQVRSAVRPDDEYPFWGKLPRSEFPFDALYDRPRQLDATSLRHDGSASNVSSLHSEDSRSLDITGSEDESAGGWDGN